MLDPLGPISVYKRGDDCVDVEESKREGMEPGGRGEGHVLLPGGWRDSGRAAHLAIGYYI